MTAAASDLIPSKHGPVGVLDSGVGGLSILHALRQTLPGEAFLYIADQTHLPYGGRPLAEIRAFVRGITRFLLARQAKMIVVACNAASAAGLHDLRAAFPHVPFVGMEPAVKPAAAATQSGVVGVLTTAATAAGDLYTGVVRRFAQGARVETIICPELVHAIERNQTDLAALRPLFERKLAPVLAQGADQIVLGCTHFPFAADAIRAYAGPQVNVIDPGPAVARQARHVLESRALFNDADALPTRYYTTGDRTRFVEMVKSLTGETVAATLLAWTDGTLREIKP